MSDTTIGTIIGVLSSAIIFGLTSFIQWKRDERARKWILEDRKIQRRLDVLSVRLQEVMDLINQVFELALKLNNFEKSIIAGLDNESIWDEYSQSSSLLADVMKKSSSLMNLNDEELEHRATQAANLVVAEMDIADLLYTRFKAKEKINRKDEIFRVSIFFADVSKLRSDVMKRIDELSGLDI